MKKYNIFFIFCSFLAFSDGCGATTCSRANLTRCLDSVCAINSGSNPSARCQYCGTESAGTPPTGGMQSVSVGASAKYNLTAKELKSAPNEPGKRYAWATAQCIQKVTGCTPDDVSDAYDSLIEQSCKAAGISAEMSTLQTAARKKPTPSSCTNTIQSCIIAQNKCGSDWRACSTDSDFDKFFSACSVDASGCDEYISSVRTDLFNTRNTTIANADAAIQGIAKSYQSARENRLASARTSCKDNASRDACIESVCANNMRNKCETKDEKSMATELCKFYELACNVLK